MRRIILILIATCAVACMYYWHTAHGSMVRFDGVAGPAAPTIIAPPVPAKWDAYSKGAGSTLAILLTSPDSAWLGLAHGLKSIGVPFIITTDYQAALRHKVVYVYPTITGTNLPPEALAALAQFPSQGGTLIGQQVLGGGLNETFGFSEAVPATSVVEIRFNPQFPITAELTEPEDQAIRIGDTPDQTLGTYAYTKPQEAPLATYNDGSAAITQKSYGEGKAYGFGPDVGYLLLKGYNYRQEGIAAHYINEYGPALDSVLRCLKNIYLAGEKNGVTLATAPDGKPMAVMFTHDIDYTRSLINSLDYAAFERSHNITATYFMQTKYVKDWNDDVFFTAEGVQNLLKLQALGMEIASHSVSHSTMFSQFPIGDGKEQYPDYKPFVQNRIKTIGGTILGELRVSKFLMEHFIPGLQVESFRPGHLENPFTLPEALTATGYRFSSSTTADNSLTHLPYRLNYSRDVQAETPIYEFPLTIEDELSRPMLGRLPQAIALAGKLKRYGGLCVILIHPNIVDQKFEFEKGFVEAMGDTVWYGSIGQFGRWWAARDQVGVEVVEQPDGMIVSLSAPEAIAGLALDVPVGMGFVSSNPVLKVTQQGKRVVLEQLSGNAQLTFKKTPVIPAL